MKTLVKTIAALVLLVAACEASIVSRFFSSARQRDSEPTCDWLSDVSKLRELKWAEQVDLCLETGPRYLYPADDVATALRNDPSATEYLGYLSKCYNFNNQSYYRPWDQTVYTQDLCPVRQQLVDKVWRFNPIDRRMDHCYIVHPQLQNVAMAQCGDGTNHPDSQRCKLDKTSYFRGHHYCVPDGYVKRVVLVYCPWNIEHQCSTAQVRIPTGCSCKWYTCDKARAQAGDAFSSLASRFQV